MEIINIKTEGIRFPCRRYEGNIPFVMRFMVDKDIVGMGWIKIGKNEFIIK
jgi:DNA polymerase delta subunit 1